MSDQKFDPVNSFIALRDSLSKSIGDSVRGLAGSSPFPALDVYASDAEVVIYTEPLLGLIPSSIEVSMEDGLLSIAGEARPFHELAEGDSWIHRELQSGAFSRQVQIPLPVDATKAAATVKSGVLTIRIPRIDAAEDHIVDSTPTTT